MSTVGITPLLLTFNEAPNIARTLSRLSWAKDIVVVDSGSTDATREIAAPHSGLAATANLLRMVADQANPIVFALVVMVLVSGMRSMLELVLMSYALVAWWGVNRLISRRASARA